MHFSTAAYYQLQQSDRQPSGQKHKRQVDHLEAWRHSCLQADSGKATARLVTSQHSFFRVRRFATERGAHSASVASTTQQSDCGRHANWILYVALGGSHWSLEK